jgi:hypothetical protein
MSLKIIPRILGALTLAGAGILHLQQYYDAYYSAIPTIGTLFVLDFAASMAVAIGLLSPVRLIAGRRADVVLTLLALAGVGIAAGSLTALVISENGGLFGFVEHGYRGAIVLAIALEAATVVLLGAFLALGRGRIHLRAPHRGTA